MIDTKFKHFKTIPLNYCSDCALIGIVRSTHLYAEEYYGAQNYLAQYIFLTDGNLIQTFDEAYGENEFEPLEVPDSIVSPHIPAHHPLDMGGFRLRGLREAERVSQWVQPLSIMEKMPLIAHLGLSISPMQLLGISESKVLSTAQLNDSVSLVCRRLRFACVLPTTQIDDDGLPYDYDSATLHIAHPYDAASDEAPPLQECLGGLGGIALQRPLDCLVHDQKLYIADASDGDHPSRIVVWHISS